VGYGPDAEGHVSMNFGPLNQVGGERRLNVAVSRARYEMKVFSTLTADMIDMNRTDAEGVRGLKEFLDFAQKGTQALSQDDVAALQKKETISEVIAGDLRKRGYEVDTQIGCSGFRIDAAIVDPDDKGRYLLGLLCDGDSYREAKTARDREICQPAVLHALGWNILKVWTVDWWNNQETVLNAIDNAVKEAKERKAMPQPEPIAPKPKPIEVEKLASAPVNTDLSGGIHKIDYTAAQIEPNNEGLESMLNPLKGANVIHQMKEVISTEGPITRSLLFKRILSIWGVSRLSQRSEYSLSGLIDAFHPVSTKEGDSVVYWPAETKDYNTFRPSGDRDITDIPVEEVANAILFSLGQVLAAPAADLCKMAANQLGFTRVGINVDAATRQAMELLLKRRLVTEKDGKIAKA
jgi:very-short-patch-repair endonuclease